MSQSPTRRPHEDQNLWNFIFSIFFVLVLVGALWAIYTNRGSWPTSISIFDAFLLVCAAFRITRLVVYDKITRFFREWFVHKTIVEHAGSKWVEMRPVEDGFRQTMADLLVCPWCVGLWSGLVVSFFYYMYPWAWFVILFLAISGLGSLVQILANMIGWRAEIYKLQAKEKEAAGFTSDRSGL